ncbi:MAG: ATP-binding protein [bacterium]
MISAETPVMKFGRPAQRRFAPAASYGVTAVAMLLALIGALALQPLHVQTNLLFVGAVAVSAWYGGRGPGLAASVVSMFAIVYLRSAPVTSAAGIGEFVYLAAFLLVALIIDATTDSLRRARLQATTRAAQLEQLTAQLEQQMEEVQTLSEHLQVSNDSLSDALSVAEDMASHAMALQDVTAALSLARTESEVADVVLERGVSAVDGQRGILARLHDDHFAIIGTRGYAMEDEAQLLALTLDDDAPIARVVKSKAALWLTSAKTTSFAVPLQQGGVVVGALEVSGDDASAMGARMQPFVLLLAQAAADALVRARSYDVELAARRDAEVLAQVRADVLGIVAHDLRNPLNLISSSSSLLLEIGERPLPQRGKMLDIMLRAVRQMDRMIGDLLDATRLRAGRLTLEVARVDACKILQQADETLQPAANQQGIQLRSVTPEEECFVRADEGRLLQVLGNLVGNAIKFTPAGGLVTVSAKAADAEVIFSVADNGLGIAPEHRDHLFDSFWQARSGDRRGVGLGLTITKEIVHAHGGRLWLESTVGMGSTFSFALPTDLETSRTSDPSIGDSNV